MVSLGPGNKRCKPCILRSVGIQQDGVLDHDSRQRLLFAVLGTAREADLLARCLLGWALVEPAPQSGETGLAIAIAGGRKYCRGFRTGGE